MSREPQRILQVRRHLHLGMTVHFFNGHDARMHTGKIVAITTVQTCIVDLIRNSLAFASWKERKLVISVVAAALRPVYTASTAEAAALCLAEFESGPWGAKFPTIGASWRHAWEHVIPTATALAMEIDDWIFTLRRCPDET